MGLRTILTFEDSSLRMKSREVTKFDRRLRVLLDDLRDTLREAGGAGLAAPQVGVLRRVCIVDIGEGLIELINPVIIQSDSEQTGPEGCLSLKGKTGLVTRPNHLKIRAQNRDGEFFEIEGEGFLARAFAHELDHLDGKLYTDLSQRFLSAEEIAAFYDDEDEGTEGDGGPDKSTKSVGRRRRRRSSETEEKT